ncbi:MAG TPA: phospholipase D-like domain-containing protein [Polyangia bacterium]
MTDLLAGGARLVTLWGPGGAGKTHLLRHFAATRAAAGEGCFCDASEARTEADLGRCVAAALRLERGGGAADGDALCDALAARPRTLLLLDNVEQIAGPARAAVALWLARAPRLRMVTTSREPLGLQGEARLEIGPLPEADAVQLFVESARAIRPLDLESEAARRVVRRVVARLDRLPLAIALCAGRLEVLEPAELLDRLGRPLDLLRAPAHAAGPRHGTLSATVRWSWDLLGPVEQQALAVCAVFRGGFATRAAEDLLAACGLDGAGLAVLESLRLRSLIQPLAPAGAGARLRLYEAVREFAAARLDERGLRKAAGVEVRAIIAEASWISANASAATFLAAQGIAVRAIPHCHVKAIIADGARAYLGSENLSWTSLSKNREVGLIVTEPAAIAVMAATFEADWAVGAAF